MAPERKLSVTVTVLVSEAEADAMFANAHRHRRSLSELVREVCRRAGLMTVETSGAAR